jgi:hypothetical protein
MLGGGGLLVCVSNRVTQRSPGGFDGLEALRKAWVEVPVGVYVPLASLLIWPHAFIPVQPGSLVFLGPSNPVLISIIFMAAGRDFLK